MKKVGEYYYEKRGSNYAVYVVETITPPKDTAPNAYGMVAGPTIHSRKVEEHFDPETARRRVYELNGWNNYKPLHRQKCHSTIN